MTPKARGMATEPEKRQPVWDPAQYLRFGDHRLRPALDLLGRIDVDGLDVVHDLGCGPGNLAPALAGRWPSARIVGIDASPEMLAKARAEHPQHVWIEADAATWQPANPSRLTFSNAALQWVGDHAALFPHLIRNLVPGGVLAVQMPHNHASPSHLAMTEIASDARWAARLVPLIRVRPVLEPEEYHALLSPHVAQLDIWQTIYLQELDGDNAVAEWTRGSALKPLLDGLDDDAERKAFFDAYSAVVQAAYPRGANGTTLFPFRRLFMVARR